MPNRGKTIGKFQYSHSVKSNEYRASILNIFWWPKENSSKHFQSNVFWCVHWWNKQYVFLIIITYKKCIISTGFIVKSSFWQKAPSDKKFLLTKSSFWQKVPSYKKFHLTKSSFWQKVLAVTENSLTMGD